jgi:two-component system C4-dicarboxylate transport sensor histidine kinase DctB
VKSASSAAAVPESELALAHARFAQVAMWIYVATASVGIVLLVLTLAADRAHQKDEARERLSLETQVRAHYLARHLHLLVEELTRLGLRSEVDLLDENMAPERSLLRLSHENSAVFNVGVAILDRTATVVWSEPQTFLAAGLPPSLQGLMDTLHRTEAVQIVPGQEARGTSAPLYVASPIMRGAQFTGALLGAIDLVSGAGLESGHGPQVTTVLAAREGGVIYPPGPNPDRAGLWLRLRARGGEPFVSKEQITGREAVVAGAPVQGTDFTLLSIVDAATLLGPAQRRLLTRLASGLTLASVPLVILVVQLRRSLRTFRRSEEDAVRNERLRSLGEAADVIAHEVKNSLNNLSVGLDVVLRGDRLLAPRGEGVTAMRREIERLADFTTELLSFSKGVVPRPVSLDLSEFVPKVADLARETAENRGVRLDVVPVAESVRVRVDPSLVHVVVANLLGNAVDFALQGTDGPPRVTIGIDAGAGEARVRVIDNGPGVAGAVRARIFEPFVTGRPNGVGIGLALSRNIARAHGGDLTLEESMAGASFRLTLPLEAP